MSAGGSQTFYKICVLPTQFENCHVFVDQIKICFAYQKCIRYVTYMKINFIRNYKIMILYVLNA